MAVKLNVHRNTVEARRKRTLSKELRNHTAKMVRDNDIRAYAIVGIAADGQAHAIWDTGAVLPIWAFADVVSHILREDIRTSDPVDDWRPVLTPQGTKPLPSRPGRHG